MWLVGIDEAGYGPNLGPFVMSAAAVRVPEPAADVWRLLAPAVCRAAEAGRDEPRLVVDDSKAVYSPSKGMGRLERGLWPFLANGAASAVPLADLWARHVLTPLEHLAAEPWGRVHHLLPAEKATTAAHAESLPALHAACAAGSVAVGPLWSVVVFPRQFNALVDAHNSKAAVPLLGLKRLLDQVCTLTGTDRVEIVVDRLGGRQNYQAVLQEAFPHTLVLCRGESPARSTYAVSPTCNVTFRVKADAECFSVALASMLSKYLREVLMTQFNAYWRQHLPGLKPTAGYPGDAERFWKETAAVRQKLRLPEEWLWRKR
jgi:ribonuclease HII